MAAPNLIEFVYSGKHEKPCFATSQSAGFDLRAHESVTIEPGECHLFDTMIQISRAEPMPIPRGQFFNQDCFLFLPEIQIRARSSMFRRGFITEGTIDSDYRGNIMVVLFNISNKTQKIIDGERIAQAVISFTPRISNISATDKNRLGGFGSTGRI